MSEMEDRVETAIFEACDYALPPHLLRKATRAAIEAMREHLVQCANRDKEQAYYATIEEIEEALGKVDA